MILFILNLIINFGDIQIIEIQNEKCLPFSAFDEDIRSTIDSTL